MADKVDKYMAVHSTQTCLHQLRQRVVADGHVLGAAGQRGDDIAKCTERFVDGFGLHNLRGQLRQIHDELGALGARGDHVCISVLCKTLA